MHVIWREERPGNLNMVFQFIKFKQALRLFILKGYLKIHRGFRTIEWKLSFVINVVTLHIKNSK